MRPWNANIYTPSREERSQKEAWEGVAWDKSRVEWDKSQENIKSQQF